jgi:hypothetical protein
VALPPSFEHAILITISSLIHCLAVHPPTYLSISSICFVPGIIIFSFVNVAPSLRSGHFCSLYPNSGACARCCNSVSSSKAPLIGRLTSTVCAPLF